MFLKLKRRVPDKGDGSNIYSYTAILPLWIPNVRVVRRQSTQPKDWTAWTKYGTKDALNVNHAGWHWIWRTTRATRSFRIVHRITLRPDSRVSPRHLRAEDWSKIQRTRVLLSIRKNITKIVGKSRRSLTIPNPSAREKHKNKPVWPPTKVQLHRDHARRQEKE